MKIRKIVFAVLCCVFFASCVSTYNTTNLDILSDSEEDSSIHYQKTTEEIKADNSIDYKMVGFYTVGLPLVTVGCTVRETARVAGYSILNMFAGGIAYERMKNGKEGMGLILPDTKKAKKEYADFQKAYEESDLYKYRKYRNTLSKADITKTSVVEEVDWNDESKVVSATTETVHLQKSVGDTASRVSKKASLIGARIGTVTSVIFGIPSYIIGFILSAMSDSK